MIQLGEVLGIPKLNGMGDMECFSAITDKDKLVLAHMRTGH